MTSSPTAKGCTGWRDAATFAAAARQDLSAIFDHGVLHVGLKAAEAYSCGFSGVFDLIRAHPLSGALDDSVRPPIRSLRCGSHRVYYDVLNDRAVVQRILHHARDVVRWLRGLGDRSQPGRGGSMS